MTTDEQNAQLVIHKLRGTMKQLTITVRLKNGLVVQLQADHEPAVEFDKDSREVVLKNRYSDENYMFHWVDVEYWIAEKNQP